jgi:D-tyrosyl-tRNA(Tyr) deacylase
LRALIQRVLRAAVLVDGESLGQIGPGLAVFVGISREDDEADADYIVSKIVNLRIFSDEGGRFNLSALDIEAQLLVISQFTLYADTRKGRRPSFSDAGLPEEAAKLFDVTLGKFKQTGLVVETGRFQAHMLVSIENDGPVTIMLDSEDRNRPHQG